MILPLKEFELLALLASYPDRTFSREQLIEFVWGNDFIGNDRTVDVHIKRLRERFPERKADFTIQTIRGLGYKLEDRKSTRLNSSHVAISYAVFCLKQKKKNQTV